MNYLAQVGFEPTNNFNRVDDDDYNDSDDYRARARNFN